MPKEDPSVVLRIDGVEGIGEKDMWKARLGRARARQDLVTKIKFMKLIMKASTF